MNAVDWTQRARDFLKTSPPSTDETDERGVPSVLSVLPPLVLESLQAANEPQAPVDPDDLEVSGTDSDRWCWPHSSAWNTAEIDAFTSRTMLFIRRGINATQADDLAEALVKRDREGDERRMCIECSHLSGSASHTWRCRSAVAAGLSASASIELPGNLVTQCQRCPAYEEASP